VYGADDGLVGWVDDVEGLAFYAFDKLVVDEPVGREVLAGLAGESFVAHTIGCYERGRGAIAYRPVGCSYSPVAGVLTFTDVILYK
jgi:hypothetical protein